MELFEEGADFVEILSRYFVGSHGQRLKTSYADALTHLLLPVAKVSCRVLPCSNLVLTGARRSPRPRR